MKKVIQRWNELAGTGEKGMSAQNQKMDTQNLYGNAFAQEMLNETVDEKDEEDDPEKSAKEAKKSEVEKGGVSTSADGIGKERKDADSEEEQNSGKATSGIDLL